MNRLKSFMRALHRDESGPNTVEWILLIIIALVLIIAIFVFANFVIGKFKQKQQQVTTDKFLT